jgi:hypothetical protein
MGPGQRGRALPSRGKFCTSSKAAKLAWRLMLHPTGRRSAKPSSRSGHQRSSSSRSTNRSTRRGSGPSATKRSVSSGCNSRRLSCTRCCGGTSPAGSTATTGRSACRWTWRSSSPGTKSCRRDRASPIRRCSTYLRRSDSGRAATSTWSTVGWASRRENSGRV